jgi:hypothetical protein
LGPDEQVGGQGRDGQSDPILCLVMEG